MRLTRPLILLVLALCLAPASALAQSAGDEQYVDPFQNAEGDRGGGGGGGGGGGQGGSAGGSQDGSAGGGETTAPTQTTEPDSTAVAPEESAAADSAANGETLPVTGLELWWPALLGAALLAAGLALRRRANLD